MWRTFLGRTAALRSLKREPETLAESPDYRSTGNECPAAYRARCVAHLKWLSSTHPRAFGESKSQYVGQSTGYERIIADVTGGDTPTFIENRVDVADKKGWVVMRMRPVTVTAMKTGETALMMKSDDINYAYASDCKKVPVVREGKVVHEEECAERGRDTAKGRTVKVVLSSASTVTSTDEKTTFDVAVDISALRRSANDREYTFTKSIVLKVTDGGVERFNYGVDVRHTRE